MMKDFGANESWKKRFSSPLIINYYQETNLRDEHLFSNGLYPILKVNLSLLLIRLAFKLN